MRQWVALGVCAGLLSASACGGDDDAGLKGTGGSSSGGSSSGGSSSGGSPSGGAAGTATGGGAGTATGGSAGTGTGGSAGSDASVGGTGGGNTGGTSSGGSGGGSTGGTSSGGTSSGGTSSGGSGGGNTGGTGGGGSAGCPSTAPSPGTSCNVAGAVCCYGNDPVKPVRCVPTSVDGGGPYQWATLNSKVCCPASAPTIGNQCNAPGDLKCCYGNTGFYCNNQPQPDVWASGTCN